MSRSRDSMVQGGGLSARRACSFRAAAFFIGVAFVGCLASTTALAQSMQFVAHQDDDILFINPDLRNSLQAGWASTTVYLTAGEAQGVPPTQTREQFAASRQEGARAAYASMMGVTFQSFSDINSFPKDIDSKWVRSLCLIQGSYVEVDQLIAAPQVKLVFLNLLEAGDNQIFNGLYPLVHLFYDQGAPEVPTLVPKNWPTETCVWPEFALAPDVQYAPPPSYYDHEKLAGVLLALLNKVQPKVVRTLDPYPYESVCGSDVDHITCYPPNPVCVPKADDPGVNICVNSNNDPPTDTCSSDGDCGHMVNPQYTGYLVRYDNSDHQMTARFVREVLSTYGQHNLTLNYIGYSISDRQGNLSDIEYGLKKEIANAYGRYDGNYPLNGEGGWYPSWFGATYERNPSNTTWLQRFRDGRLAAFGVRGDRVAMWYEVCPGGGNWYGPISLGNDSSINGPVAPGIAVGSRSNGLLQLFFLRTPQPPMAGVPQIWTVAQNASEDTFGSEVPLGTPSVTTPDWTSAPAVVTDANGYFWIFVKNDTGGVSANHEFDKGKWLGWTDLPGDPANGEASGGAPDVIEGIVTAQDALGRVQVFAQTRFGVIHQWYQQSASGPWVFVPVFPSNAPAYLTHGLGVGKNADGRLEVFYRGAGRPPLLDCGGFGCNAQVFSVREQSAGGPWGTETDLYGDAGRGPLAVVRHPTGPLQLFELNYYGGVSGISESGANGSFSPFQWQDFGGRIVHYPSAAIDSSGRTALSAFGPNGKLYLRRQQTSAASAPFSEWALVESGLVPSNSPRNMCVTGKK